MRRLLEYDPFSGVKTYFDSEGGTTGDWTFSYEFDDVSVEETKSQQNDPDYWKAGVKGGRVKYAHIPDPILLRWHCEGINIKDPQALFAQVNKREYSYLKTTNKVHVVKG